jgi:hypothetical protein
MNFAFLRLTPVQFAASLNLLKSHAPREGAAPMRYVRLAVFSLVLLTTISVSVTINGANAGSSKGCLGTKGEHRPRQSGILKNNYEISGVDIPKSSCRTSPYSETDV